LLGELGPYFDNRRPMYMRPFNLTGQPALSGITEHWPATG
jgi:hypothetical protein